MSDTTPFQDHLSKDVENLFYLMDYKFEKFQVKSEDDYVGTFIKYSILDDNIRVFIYSDQSEVHDVRENSERHYHFENYTSMTLDRIHKDTIVSLKHVMATPNSYERSHENFDAPAPNIQLWPIKWPWKKRK